jgi:hypothetical protein
LRRLVRKDVAAAILAALLLVFSNGGVFTSYDWKVIAAISIGIYLITLRADWKTWYAPAGLATFFLAAGHSGFCLLAFARFVTSCSTPPRAADSQLGSIDRHSHKHDNKV